MLKLTEPSRHVLIIQNTRVPNSSQGSIFLTLLSEATVALLVSLFSFVRSLRSWNTF